MPVINGFEVVNSIPIERLPHIIFVTAYDQYAIKAFEIHAVDYILKPFTNARFAEGLARAKVLIKQHKAQWEQEKLISMAKQFAQKSPDTDLTILSPKADADRLIVKEKGHVKFILLEDIIWFEAYDYYVKIHVKNQFHLIRESMKKLELRLPSDQFIRIHKSSIINLKYIKEIITGVRNDYSVILINQTELNVGRSYKESVKKLSI